ncbi:SOS response-associated peptidase family protein [Burkholderia cenocepacia]|uniref:SOS response-associated peptidase family protein n=1 Tax=Burkholderia cenocepacia TaxID=95486 RepID=UPI0039083525
MRLSFHPLNYGVVGGGWDCGPCVWQKIGLADWGAYCVAGIWQRYQGDDGRVLVSMTKLALNADEHSLIRLMHRPEDEKRGVVILRPADYDEWLHTTNVDVARTMMQLYPAEEMASAPK